MKKLKMLEEMSLEIFNLYLLFIYLEFFIREKKKKERGKINALRKKPFTHLGWTKCRY